MNAGDVSVDREDAEAALARSNIRSQVPMVNLPY
jgi:hypothetical protein